MGCDEPLDVLEASGEPAYARLAPRTGQKSIFASSELRRLPAVSKRRWDKEGQEWTVIRSQLPARLMAIMGQHCPMCIV
jgi:hypothetical protein